MTHTVVSQPSPAAEPPAAAEGPVAPSANEGETALAYVIRELEELIVGQHEAGDQLPAESALATRYGVSRLTIREALKVLAGQGLVELSRGRRPTVRQADSSVMSRFLAIAIRRDPRAVLELHSIRRPLEVLSAGEASKRASRAALAAVSSSLDDMERAALALDGTEASIRRYNSADVGFHEALALASGNQMLALILESLAESLHHSFSQSFEGFMDSGRDILEAVADHRAILERVTAGDSAGAERAMRSHLDGAERDLYSVLNRQGARKN